jgi:hypothetical protein
VSQGGGIDFLVFITCLHGDVDAEGWGSGCEVGYNVAKGAVQVEGEDMGICTVTSQAEAAPIE